MGQKFLKVLNHMLDQVLAHSGLTNLKGVATEVDTRPIPLIVDEYRRFLERMSVGKARRGVKSPVVENHFLAKNFFGENDC